MADLRDYIVYQTPIGTVLIDVEDVLWTYGCPAFSKSECKVLEQGQMDAENPTHLFFAYIRSKYEQPHTKKEEAEVFESWKRAKMLGKSWNGKSFAKQQEDGAERTIQTPRGRFYVVEGEKVRVLKEEGYGYHHEIGEYIVVCSNNTGVAVSVYDYKRYFKEG